jgi:uncharacterized cupredoxin-like copper-binding protein
VKLVAGGEGSVEPGAGDQGDEPVVVGGNADPADDTVNVSLTEYTIAVDQGTVAAGNIEFATENSSADEVHELAVLRIEEDGGREVIGEIEDIPPGVSSSIKVEMEVGQYQLACLIVPGEAGSEVDHYKEGMRADFTVE